MADKNKPTKEYYPHYYGERNTPKMVRLFMSLGMEGVGIYSYLKEKIAENNGVMGFDDIPAIAFEFRIDNPDGIKKLERVICEFGLFDVDEKAKTFSSPEIQENLQFRAELSEKRREAVNTRYKGKEENAAPKVTALDTAKLSGQITAFIKKYPDVKIDVTMEALKKVDIEELTEYAERRNDFGSLQGYTLSKLIDDFDKNNEPPPF